MDLPAGSSLLDLVGLQQDLSDLLGIEVDAHTYRSIHPDFIRSYVAELFLPDLRAEVQTMLHGLSTGAGTA